MKSFIRAIRRVVSGRQVICFGFLVFLAESDICSIVALE
jgi:hypothetical protein